MNKNHLKNKAKRVLAYLRVSEYEVLPAGGEGLLFAAGDRVIKVYKEHATLSYLEQMAAFQEKLKTVGFSFSTPRILDIGEVAGTFYTIESRLPGEQLGRKIVDFDARERQHVYLSYYQAAEQIGEVKFDSLAYGQILDLPQSLTATSWSEFLVSKLRQRLQQAHVNVTKLVSDFVAKADYLADLIESKCHCEDKRLVHADYYLDNVLVDPDKIEITAVLDFGLHMVVGDPRFDIMSVLRWNNISPEVNEQDYDFLLALARQDFGDDLDMYMDLYYLYSCFYYADMEDPSFSIQGLNDQKLWDKYGYD